MTAEKVALAPMSSSSKEYGALNNCNHCERSIPSLQGNDGHTLVDPIESLRGRLHINY